MEAVGIRDATLSVAVITVVAPVGLERLTLPVVLVITD
jgi:hypothetical protein